jgi:PE family
VIKFVRCFCRADAWMMTEWGCGMSFVIAVPEMVASAASNLTSLGSMISEANAAAPASTTGVAAAAGDEVSAAIASLFSSHARDFQALSAQAAAFHAQFVQALAGAGNSYAATEAANASLLLKVVEQDVAEIGAGYVQADAELLTAIEAFENSPMNEADELALQQAFAFYDTDVQELQGEDRMLIDALRALIHQL